MEVFWMEAHMIYQGSTLSARYVEPGIAELCFDLEGEPINKFNQATLDELQAAVAALAEQTALKGLLVTSAKSGFIVGADITEFCELFSLAQDRSEEHTSELQSRGHLVCR